MRKLRVALARLPTKVLIFSAALLTGCANIAPQINAGAANLSAAELDAETVFVYQSRMADEVIARTAQVELDESGAADPLLVAADARMTKRCRYLNEAAVSRAEGHAMKLGLRLKVFTTTGECARAAQDVELLLRNHSTVALTTAKL